MTNRYYITEFRHVETALEGIDDRLRALAARIEEVAAGLPSTEAADLAHDMALPDCRDGKHVGTCRHAEPAKDGAKVPEGFEVCAWEEATTGGYHNEQRLAARGDGGVEIVKLGEWNPPDIIWLRPIPQPDPERLADEIERSGVHSNASVPMADIVRRALARCRT